MRRLELDYQKPANPPRKTAAWVLLVAGLALLIEMGMSYDRLQNDRETMNRQIRTSGIRLDVSRNDTGDYQFTDKDFAQARQIINRLSIPWDTFFTGIESVSNANVAILSIEPDIQSGQLRIEGEAKDYAAVLTLVARLSTTKPFSEVFLLRHETKHDDPQHPVSFTVSMHWVKLS
jgi:Fimbrial assembly protein (PilN)